MGTMHQGRRTAAVTIGLTVFALLFASCELLFMQPVPANSPTSIFEQTWKFADEEYSFFGLKEVDWDDTYRRYRDRFTEGMTDTELFDTLSEMLYELKDGHVNLRSSFDVSRYWEWYLGYPQNFDYALLERNYFNGEEQFVGPFVTMDFGDIVYARYGSFSSGFSDGQLDYLLTEFSDRDGFILDVRDNGGGSVSNAYRIANRLVSQRLTVGRQRFKNGPGRDDFTAYENVALDPPEGRPTWQAPFVILTNRSSYSATNLLVALTCNLPQVKIIGDTTGGGGGIPVFTELTNGWVLRVSGHQFVIDVYTQAEELQVELGIDPHPGFDVDMDPADAAAGIDTILETALAYIRSL